MNARASADFGTVNAAGRSARRASVPPSRQRAAARPAINPAAARPAIDRARDASVPWLLVLIVIGALAVTGVLIILLARLVALPAADPSFAPGPAPLSRSRQPSAEESETREWSGPRDPTYAR
jgi:hypothetical protein